MQRNKAHYFIIAVILMFFSTKNNFLAQRGFYEPLEIDTVGFNLGEFGSMWTFDSVPILKWQTKYNFSPGKEWLDKVMKSALQFGGGCSAAFVSEDGLIMTNHHCGRSMLKLVEKEGENLLRDGFFAETLEEERKIPGLYVDQLKFIEDVTDSIKSETAKGKTAAEKTDLKNAKILELERNYSERTGLLCKVVSLYHGGKYSLYGYKRYDDIRLVMSPDFQIAATGWDWDNFTYPRYELDFAFYRAYNEKKKPLKVDNYFKWSKNGAKENEPVFVVGRPGRTYRLISVAELNYLREKVYRFLLKQFNEIYYVYFRLFQNRPEEESKYLRQIMRWGNARKSYAGRLAALNDEYIMKKKTAFENDLKSKIHSDESLNAKYGFVWDSIATVINKLKATADEYYALNARSAIKPVYFNIAKKIIRYAEQMKLPETERQEDYLPEKIDSTLAEIYPADIDEELNMLLLKAHTKYIQSVLGENNKLIKDIYGGRKGINGAVYVFGKSGITSREKFNNFISLPPDSILNSNDPFIRFVKYSENKIDSLRLIRQELNNSLDVYNELLGGAVYQVYGNKIPPDATLTLRISDGVIKGYEYNGTIAPGKTTFYGLWDRYFSFGGKTYPWGLHERWKTPPPELDLATPVGFASTNDIVGGNSGSSVINRNAEIVGLVHDGNIESLAGYIIFLEENNRTVATDSKGLIEALKYVYKTDRLVDELIHGKL